MRKKINTELVLIAAVAIILTSIFATFTYYRIFQTEVFGSLRTCAHVLAESIVNQAPDSLNYSEVEDDLRITLIDIEGNVLMDTNADIGGMKKSWRTSGNQAGSSDGRRKRCAQIRDGGKKYFLLCDAHERWKCFACCKRNRKYL